MTYVGDVSAVDIEYIISGVTNGGEGIRQVLDHRIAVLHKANLVRDARLCEYVVRLSHTDSATDDNLTREYAALTDDGTKPYLVYHGYPTARKPRGILELVGVEM